MERIIVGVDGSQPSRVALAWAVGLARDLEADLVVLRVTDDVHTAAQKGFCTPSQADEWAAEARSSGLADLRRMLAEVGEGPDEDEVELDVVPGQPAEVLLDRSRDADLLVLGPRGLGRLRGLLGSVSRTCLDNAVCPVTIVPEVTTTAPEAQTDV